MRILRSNVRPGDIILCRPHQLEGDVARISAEIGIPYTHACICTAEGEAAHASMTGVTRVSLAVLERVNRNLAVFRSLNPWSESQISRLNQFVTGATERALQFSTTGIYDYCENRAAHTDNVIDSFFQQLPLPTYSFTSDEVFCSEFVAQCCAMAGRFNSDVTSLLRPDVQSPRDIVSDAAFSCIFVGFVHRDCAQIASDDPYYAEQTWQTLINTAATELEPSHPGDEAIDSLRVQMIAEVDQFNELVETESLKVQYPEALR